MARGHFSSAVKRTLMQRAGARCSRPDCQRETLGPSKTLTDKGQNLGEAAHIKGASPGGARYDTAQSEEERHAAENGLWLCEFCAALVDKNGGADFSVEALTAWKTTAEAVASERLYRHSDQVLANCVSSLIYINIPRLLHYVGLTQSAASVPVEFATGIPGDGYIAPQLHQLETAIRRMSFPAMDWRKSLAFDDPTGLLVSFEGVFRTKNGPQGRRDRYERDLSNPETSPHVYQKHDGTKFILPYDPRFVTTNTAGVELNRGQARVGGFALVKYRTDTQIVASPYIIGLASTPEVRAFWDALDRR